jgi:hypothetical protein
VSSNMYVDPTSSSLLASLLTSLLTLLFSLREGLKVKLKRTFESSSSRLSF